MEHSQRYSDSSLKGGWPTRRWRHLVQKGTLLLLFVSLTTLFLAPSFTTVSAAANERAQPLNFVFSEQKAAPQAEEACPLNGWLQNLSPYVRIDWCAVLRVVLLQWAYDPLHTLVTETRDLVQRTPPYLTYDNKHVSNFWQTSLWITDALVALAITWAGIRLMFARGLGNSWLTYANAIDILPRVALALLAAHFSRSFIQIWVDANNVLVDYVFFPSQRSLFTLLDQPAGDFVTLVLQIGYGLLYLLFILQQVIRIAALDLLIVGGPIWMFCFALPETQFIGQRCLALSIFLSLEQAVQLAALSLGERVFVSVYFTESMTASLLTLLIAIGLLLFTLAIPGMLRRTAGATSGSIIRFMGHQL